MNKLYVVLCVCDVNDRLQYAFRMSASRLAWPAGRQSVPDTSNMASQFPLLQLNNADVANGSVKVVARAPSGQTHALNIQMDTNGQFKTDFVPNEVG